MKRAPSPIASALLALLAMLPLSTPASAAGQASTKGAADQDFVKEAAHAGMAEVQASKLALTKSQDQTVRNFAQRMIDDHTKANDKLKSIAQSKNLSVPDKPSDKEQKKIESLHKVSGEKFNQRYSDFFGVPAHETAINLFEREAKSGSDPDLRQFAQDTLPTLREHLQMARQMEATTSASDHKTQRSGKTS